MQMSKESTLTDAIDYIRQLQKEVLDLQTELSSMPDEEVEKQGSASSINTMTPPDAIHCQGKVELSSMGHNKFLLKITCENKRGGFGKLVEVINTMGFEVTNVSSVAFSYVSQSVFFIEAKDGVIIPMGELKEFLSAFVGASEDTKITN
ncbi:putative transcription factor bHLH family [Dioscorea sansibarensis]